MCIYIYTYIEIFGRIRGPISTQMGPERVQKGAHLGPLRVPGAPFLASAIICNPNRQMMVRLHHTLHKQVCLILYFGVICIIIYLILIYKHTYTSFLWEEEVDEDLYSPESPLVGCGSDHSDWSDIRGRPVHCLFFHFALSLFKCMLVSSCLPCCQYATTHIRPQTQKKHRLEVCAYCIYIYWGMYT